jgi:hypothetical protein
VTQSCDVAHVFLHQAVIAWCKRGDIDALSTYLNESALHQSEARGVSATVRGLVRELEFLH